MKERKKKSTLVLASCAVFSILIIFALYALTEDKTLRRYDFVRTFRQDFVSEEATIDLNNEFYYLAGASGDKIYLGNARFPAFMIECDRGLKDTSRFQLKVEGPEPRFKSIHIRIDSPYFFVAEGTQPFLLRGRLNDWIAKRFTFDSAYFSLAEPISPASFVLRARNPATREDVLCKESSNGVKLFPGLLEKQIDGIFCVDGMLHYSKKMHSVVYVYSYRNQYVVMDTSMNLRYKGNTIDPISTAQIKPDAFTSEEYETFTMSSPPLIVNRRSCVYDDWLLVNSNIHSNHEGEKEISTTSVVDIYELRSQTYLFSFYIPDSQGVKLSGLWCFDGELYVMFGNRLASYKIRKELLSFKRSLSAFRIK